MTSDEFVANFTTANRHPNSPMFRLILSLFCYGLLASELSAETLRALPVDPSEITPGAEIVEPEDYVEALEAEPIPTVEVKLEDHKPSALSDFPDAPLTPSRDDAVRLQIFLDQSHFGPGVIDGKPGRFTTLAIEAWNEANGFATDDYNAVMDAARRAVPNPFAVAIVPEIATKWVNSRLPYKKAQQVEEKRMSYRSYAEFMSERYHTDVEFIVELNGSSKTNGARPRSSLVVPNVTPFTIEKVTGLRYDPEALLGSRHVVVDTKVNQLRVFESSPTARVVTDPDRPVQVKANRALIATFPITPGQERFIKYGVWEMKNAVQLPVWRYDQSLLDGKGRSNNALNIPPGPNSPVGIIWMGLSVSGIGLHGTSNPETIGRARSAGCIRLANWDAIRLPDFVRPGASVEIR